MGNLIQAKYGNRNSETGAKLSVASLKRWGRKFKKLNTRRALVSRCYVPDQSIYGQGA